jgi:hypothetical protein
MGATAMFRSGSMGVTAFFAHLFFLVPILPLFNYFLNGFLI